MVSPNEFIYLMMFGLGVPELVVILCIIFLLFGAKKIPQLARGLGKGITEFKKGLKDPSQSNDEETEVKDEIPEDIEDKK